MKRFLTGLLLAVITVAGFNTHPITLDKPPKNVDRTYIGQYPQVYVPPKLRQWNWGTGSCVHATAVTLFRAQGRFKLANWWRENNAGGEWPKNMAAKLDAKGVKYAYTAGKGDVKFLEWACRSHRGCGVTVRAGSHMVALVHLDKKWAGIIDNNEPGHIIWIPRKTFIAEWMNSDSWAIAYLMNPPAPPIPTVIN